MFGQMAFFERLIADNDGIANVIDLSHRTFKSFFTVVKEIGFFEEARRRAIEPLILFIIDPDPKSPEAYASLHRLTEASLLPVCNRTDHPSAISDYHAPPDASAPPTSLPLLDFSLRALIDRRVRAGNASRSARCTGRRIAGLGRKHFLPISEARARAGVRGCIDASPGSDIEAPSHHSSTVPSAAWCARRTAAGCAAGGQ
jgi:hypothetical protein